MSTYRFRQWLANVPVISLALLKLCQSDSGGSVVHAQWRWRKCLRQIDGGFVGHDDGIRSVCMRDVCEGSRTHDATNCPARSDGNVAP